MGSCIHFRGFAEAPHWDTNGLALGDLVRLPPFQRLEALAPPRLGTRTAGKTLARRNDD